MKQDKNRRITPNKCISSKCSAPKSSKQLLMDPTMVILGCPTWQLVTNHGCRGYDPPYKEIDHGYSYIPGYLANLQQYLLFYRFLIMIMILIPDISDQSIVFIHDPGSYPSYQHASLIMVTCRILTAPTIAWLQSATAEGNELSSHIQLQQLKTAHDSPSLANTITRIHIDQHVWL